MLFYGSTRLVQLLGRFRRPPEQPFLYRHVAKMLHFGHMSVSFASVLKFFDTYVYNIFMQKYLDIYYGPTPALTRPCTYASRPWSDRDLTLFSIPLKALMVLSSG